MSVPRSRLGHAVGTPGALAALADAGARPETLLARHVAGDWGELDSSDRADNEASLVHGWRILSACSLSSSVKLWVTTDADRSSATLLLPSEY